MSDQNEKIITSIQIQKKNSNRVSVYINDEFAFGLSNDVLLESGIGKGDKLTEDQINKILALEDRKSAQNKALRLLAVRARSRKELNDKLSLTGYKKEVIDHVLSNLDRLGLINDAEFAKMFVRSRMITRPEGSFLLRRELQEKGIAGRDVENALSVAFEEKSEEDWALLLAKKQKRKLSHFDQEKAKKRTVGFLQRRGFNWNIIQPILDSWNELEENDEE